MIHTDMKEIKLDKNDVISLLLVLRYHILVKNDEIEQAEKDAKTGKPLAFYHNYGEFIHVLNASKNEAKELIKGLQKQTGVEMLPEQVINKM